MLDTGESPAYRRAGMFLNWIPAGVYPDGNRAGITCSVLINNAVYISNLLFLIRGAPGLPPFLDQKLSCFHSTFERAVDL